MSINRDMDKDAVREYTIEYYSATERNELGSFAETSMGLETVRWSEVKREREKEIAYASTYMWNLEKWCR